MAGLGRIISIHSPRIEREHLQSSGDALPTKGAFRPYSLLEFKVLFPQVSCATKACEKIPYHPLHHANATTYSTLDQDDDQRRRNQEMIICNVEGCFVALLDFTSCLLHLSRPLDGSQIF